MTAPAVHHIPEGGPELGPHEAALLSDVVPNVVRGDGCTLFPLSGDPAEGPTVCIEDTLTDDEVLYVQAEWRRAVADCPAGSTPEMAITRGPWGLVVCVEYSDVGSPEWKRPVSPMVGTRRRRRMKAA